MKPLSKALTEIGTDVLEGAEGMRVPSGDFRCFMPGADGKACVVCDGRGWYVVEGELRVCDNYDPNVDTGRQQALSDASGIKDLGKKTFDNFSPEVSSKRVEYSKSEQLSLHNALMIAKGFAKGKEDCWVVFEGTYGCGKTHLALAIANELIHKRGMVVRFTTAADLLDELRSKFSSGSSADGVMHVIEKYQSSQSVLILDDYGAEKSSEWAEEKLFQILNHRHVNRLPTVITTNLSVSEMSPRIGSRMQESSVVAYVKINAPDYREATSRAKKDKGPSPLEKYEHMTFDNWEQRNKSHEIAEEAMRRWVEKEPIPVIYMTGPYGCGKTHLAAAVANEIYENTKDLTFITLRELGQEIHDSIGDNSMPHVLSGYMNKEIMFIDDFQPDNISAWAMKQVFDIIEDRMLRRKRTVFTSVLPVSKLRKRLKTRLGNSKLCYELVVKGDG